MCRMLKAKLLARESSSPTLDKAASASGRREQHDVDAEQVGVPDGFPLQRSSDRVFLLLLHLSMIHPDDLFCQSEHRCGCRFVCNSNDEGSDESKSEKFRCL